MIRLSAALVAAALGMALWLMLETDAQAATAFTFVGGPMLGAGVALYFWSLIRPVHMTPDEQALYDLVFSDLRQRDFVRIARLGEWRSAGSGDLLMRRGEELGAVLVLLSGRVAIEREGEPIGEIGPGEMIGSAAILIGEEAWGNAVVREPCRYLMLPVASVQPWIEKNPPARIALQATVSRDLAEKLRRMTQERA